MAGADHARALAALERDARAHPRDARVQLAIGQTLQHAPAIDAYEAAQRSEKSWMPAISPSVMVPSLTSFLE